MINHEFAMRTALVARCAAAWAHDSLAMGASYAIEETKPETAKRFCAEIRDLLSRIDPDSSKEEQPR